MHSHYVMIQTEDIVACLNAMFEHSDGRGMWHVWGRAEVHKGFLWLNLRERDHLEDLGVDGRITFIRILKKWDGKVHCFHKNQDRDRCQVLVNGSINFHVP